ncbi:hypothetical protein M2152_000175 [Microbacteriaceae bacterium SG_E_30_P1]|uniref:Uncharacterized protein n=1 Tax=Antiquaquibacter oligotrophicus TaxID=2880260 RepID=A0ABT6KKM4_9MICO|nr:DUF6350 family protein [Antiquaquibacter oligotrophicus]MDH6179993.1 hypothetical protein [Antiquaquibacter oligotrophicus]UDF14251.1 DUF6350 family protein [Antiquaquibacter oligotrophicus]
MISRPLTALFAALEALLVVAIGLAIPLVPLSIQWVVQFGFGPDWLIFWRTAVDIWLLGHGVDVTFTLDPAIAGALGLPGADQPFTVSIAALGIGMLTALLGVRAGFRVAETAYRGMGFLVTVSTFVVASVVLAASALEPMARPSLVQAAVLPVLFFGGGVLIARVFVSKELPPAPRRVRILEAVPQVVRDLVSMSFRGGAAIAALLFAASAVITTIAIVTSYADIITLYESLHTDVLGGVLVTLGQLALAPVAVIWTASWLVGPGFAVGTGSLVSPLGTSVGPIPAIPLLGALPSGDAPFAFVGLLVPLLSAFLVGAWFGPGIRRRFEGYRVLVASVGMGLAAGLIIGVLAWLASGGAGPGRLADVGPNAIAVGGVAAILCSVAASVGVAASGRLPRRESRTP